MPRSRIAVSLIFMICGFVYANWSTRLPQIQAQFGLTNSTLGLMLLCVAVGSLISMPLTGWLIAQRGSRFATTLTTLCFCGTLCLFPLLSAPWHLAVFFGVVGVFTGALDVAMNAQAVLVEQRFNQPMMSSFHAIFSVGMMVGALGGSFFANYSVNTHFLMVSALCFGVAWWCLLSLITDQGAATGDEAKFSLPNRATFLLGIVAFCAMLGEGAMADWSTNYLRNVIGTDATTAPLGLSAFSAAMTIGRLGGDQLRTQWGDSKLIFYNSLLATCGLVLALVLPYAWGVIVGLFIVGLGLSTVVPIVYSTAGHDKTLPPGVALSVVTTLGYGGFLLGPPVIGFLADEQGLRFALYFVVLLFGAMLLLSRRVG